VRVPLVVVTGFLGAGKTTLVNRLLANRAARGATTGKLGVIVNELGEVGIDGALLGSEATKQVELPGGCVCCVLGPELDQTLLDLVQTNPDLEAIVLETTGVAEPLPIAWALRREPVEHHVRLAAVVTLVDAANFRASQTVSVSVNSQVAYADVLLVTKEAIAGANETEAAIAVAQALSPRAIVRRGSTEEHASWLEQVLADPAIERVEIERSEASHDSLHGHDPDHVHDETCRDADSHAHGVDSTYLDVEARLDIEELEDQLAELPSNYVRIKGIVRGADGTWTVVHRVGVRVSSEPFERKPDVMLGENGRIVALGTNLSSEKLAECLRPAYVT
jgi:G3E family GTPase